MAFTFRPSDKSQKAIDRIKKSFDIKTNSKVLEHVLMNYEKVVSSLENSQNYSLSLEKELSEFRQTVLNKFNADREFEKFLSKKNNY